jgi:hypothetical protein
MAKAAAKQPPSNLPCTNEEYSIRFLIRRVLYLFKMVM